MQIYARKFARAQRFRGQKGMEITMKKILALVMVAVLAIAMVACGGATTTEKEVLTMGTNAAFPPYEFVDADGSIVGIDAEIAAAVAEKLGMNDEFTEKKDSLKQYIEEISNYSLISVEQEAVLAKQIHGKNEKKRQKAIEMLILSNLRLVVKIAHDFRGSGLPIADLISEGNIGLMHSGRTFDPKLGSKFSTYAAWWIKQSMRRAIANQTRTIRVPVQTGTKMNRIKQTRILLKNELEREPTDLEVAEYLDLSEKTVASLRRAENSIFSLQAQILAGEESSFEELIPDPNAVDPGAAISNEDSMELLREGLNSLDPREREIITMRYFENKTLDEVSRLIGRTRERVRQIQNQALAKLKELMIEESEIVAS